MTDTSAKIGVGGKANPSLTKGMGRSKFSQLADHTEEEDNKKGSGEMDTSRGHDESHAPRISEQSD